MSLQFKPTHKYNELFDFAKFYGEFGNRQFDGTYSKKKYEEFLKIATVNNISEKDWPYYHIEKDFYSYNAMGYRTYEFSDLENQTFDIAIGCSFTEGIGIRLSETWVSHLEKKLDTKIVNLGKGGASAKYIKHTLFAWVMSNKKLPKRIFILWTEPTRKTYVRASGGPQHLNHSWSINNILDEHDIIINEVYKKTLSSNVMWSNDFVEDYCSVNILMKSLNVEVHNFLIDSMWHYEEVDFLNYTGIVPHNINFNKDVIGWYKTTGGVLIYPAYDGMHLGERHHISVVNQICKVMNNEKD